MIKTCPIVPCWPCCMFLCSTWTETINKKLPLSWWLWSRLRLNPLRKKLSLHTASASTPVHLVPSCERFKSQMVSLLLILRFTGGSPSGPWQVTCIDQGCAPLGSLKSLRWRIRFPEKAQWIQGTYIYIYIYMHFRSANSAKWMTLTGLGIRHLNRG